MDLKHVKGIVMTPEGECHSFGIHKYGTVQELTDENYHDTAYKADITTADWFQAFIKYNNYTPKNETVYRESMTLAGLGLVFLFNGCDLTARNEEHNAYYIQCPEVLADKQKEKFQENYKYLDELIETDSAIFEATAYTTKGDYALNDSLYDLDSFYDKLEIPKSKEKAR